MMDITIRVFEERDWEQVKSIYVAGIATGNATFETSTPTYEKWVSSVIPHSHLVAEADGIILG
jgi:phosphinothricin acetyltransferase